MMKERSLKAESATVKSSIHSRVLIVGSGAAGLNTALQLHSRGIEDIIIITEGLDGGTSINTGSDKQTYYKIGMNGSVGDSPRSMAVQYLGAGSAHGDLALVESALSGRAFLNLVNLGVDFPSNAYGEYIGYKTDHDDVGRGTSVGPYTSRDMCRALIKELKRRKVRIDEGVHAARLVTAGEGENRRVLGAVAIDGDGTLLEYRAEQIVFAVGGPGGLYATSVYPAVHIGAIGLALEAGAEARGLPECQYGLASTKFRWNVSGTYMQVIPRFVSTDSDRTEEPREFLLDYFSEPPEAHSMVFLKGYQWPFDSAKLPEGSSLIDLFVFIETVEKGRRVFLDYTGNPAGFNPDHLDEEARTYLENSGALQDTPIERLRHMNPGAIVLYSDHNIDIATELLEIAVCAQHNNGGLAGDSWWRSENLSGLYPVGEVNGSHGVARPGGSALNAGQVGGYRIAEIIDRGRNSHGERNSGKQFVDEKTVDKFFREAREDIENYLGKCAEAEQSWKSVRDEIQFRMTRYGAHIRSREDLAGAVDEARQQWEILQEKGCHARNTREKIQALRNRHLSLSQLIYLEAMLFQIDSGVGSRGSALVMDSDGIPIHPHLSPARWSFLRENPEFRDKVLISCWTGRGVENAWKPVRPVPETDDWFETAWAHYRSGCIYT